MVLVGVSGAEEGFLEDVLEDRLRDVVFQPEGRGHLLHQLPRGHGRGIRGRGRRGAGRRDGRGEELVDGVVLGVVVFVPRDVAGRVAGRRRGVGVGAPERAGILGMTSGWGLLERGRAPKRELADRRLQELLRSGKCLQASIAGRVVRVVAHHRSRGRSFPAGEGARDDLAHSTRQFGLRGRGSGSRPPAPEQDEGRRRSGRRRSRPLAALGLSVRATRVIDEISFSVSN